MDLRRVRVWEWLTGLAGLALLVSLFLPWYGLSGHTVSGWESLTVIDVVLAIVGLGALALPAVTAMQRTASVPQALTALVLPFALVAAVLALIRLLHTPDLAGAFSGSGWTTYAPLDSSAGGLDPSREIGVWLAAAASIAVFAFDYRSMGDKSFPRAMRPRLDIATIPSPTADGERRDVST
jgi:hypothetical protein